MMTSTIPKPRIAPLPQPRVSLAKVVVKAVPVRTEVPQESALVSQVPTMVRLAFSETGSRIERNNPYELKAHLQLFSGESYQRDIQIGTYRTADDPTISHICRSVVSELDELKFNGQIVISPLGSPTRLLSSGYMMQCLPECLSSLMPGRVSIESVEVDNR